MTALPSRLRVRVVPALHAELPVARLLIGLTIQWHGRDYFSTLLGLTDLAGALEITGEEIASNHRLQQSFFPMDYKLTLEECDHTAIVDLGGGRDFDDRRTYALSSPLVIEPYRTWWRDATNQAIAADQVAIEMNGDSVEAVLKARRIGIP